MKKYDIVMPFLGSFLFRQVEGKDEEEAVAKVAALMVPDVLAYRDNVDCSNLGEDVDCDTEDLITWDPDNATADLSDGEEEDDDEKED